MIRILSFVLVLFAAGVSAAEDPIGYVKTVSGDASITTAGNVVKAAVGTPVHQGSVIKTGAKSSLGVTFKDETVMSFGADTVFAVDEYVYAPNQGKAKLASNLSKGSLNYVSGIIAKMQPGAVSVKTPTGTIGVRGTQFLVKVDN
jgi:hypothetical protein